MIPKIIHYVWLSNDPFPIYIKECIRSWKRIMPDYKIIKWTTENFDVAHAPEYVKEAIRVKKWAFASDYIRLYVLYTFGGIYLDSDVFVKKSFDFALDNRFFSGMECYSSCIEEIQQKKLLRNDGTKVSDDAYILGIQIQAAVMGAEKGHPFLKDCMRYYETHHFLREDGTWDSKMISPIIYANEAIKYGFKYLNREQELREGMKLYSPEVIVPEMDMRTPEAVAIHCCVGSWRKIQKELPFSVRFRNYCVALLQKLCYLLHLKSNRFLKVD